MTRAAAKAAATATTMAAATAAAVTLASLLLPIPALADRSELPYGTILEGAGKSVVAVRYQLRPKERPTGGEGLKTRRLTVGVVTGPRGQVVINASSFPDTDDGPDAVEPFDFRIVVGGGREIPADIAGLSRELNLAFLRVKDPAMLTVPSVSFDGAAPLAIGDEVFVIGVLSEPYDFRPVVYHGHLNGRPSGSKGMFTLDTVLPDLCGGGLVVRGDGRAAGIVGLDPLPEEWDGAEAGNLLSLFSSANQGLRPAYLMIYPANLFANLLSAPPAVPTDASEKDRKGWLGITMQPLSRDLGDYWGIDGPGGVILGAVLPGSPAADAGLLPGDVILDVAGEPIPIRENRDLPMMQARIKKAGAGQDTQLRIWRGGEIRDVSVKLSQSPLTVLTAEEYENESFGLTVRELTYDVVQAMNLSRETRGVVVSKTERAGWAEVAGIDRGDIVQKIDGIETSDLVSFKKALESAKTNRRPESLFLVLRSYRTRFVRIQTDWR